MISYRQEIYRKLIHLSSLWMVALLWFTDQYVALVVFGSLVVGMALTEFLRTRVSFISDLYQKIFGQILREHEKSETALTGAFYVCLAAFLSALLFSKEVAMLSLSVMLISDTMAALVGRRYGSIKILDKSLEGSAVFLFSALVLVFLFYKIGSYGTVFLIAGIIGAIAATVVELVSRKLSVDDNLSITLTLGGVIYLALMALSE